MSMLKHEKQNASHEIWKVWPETWMAKWNEREKKILCVFRIYDIKNEIKYMILLDVKHETKIIRHELHFYLFADINFILFLIILII